MNLFCCLNNFFLETPDSIHEMSVSLLLRRLAHALVCVSRKGDWKQECKYHSDDASGRISTEDILHNPNPKQHIFFYCSGSGYLIVWTGPFCQNIVSHSLAMSVDREWKVPPFHTQSVRKISVELQRCDPFQLVSALLWDQSFKTER